jgi:hypothetical protein
MEIKRSRGLGRHEHIPAFLRARDVARADIILPSISCELGTIIENLDDVLTGRALNLTMSSFRSGQGIAFRILKVELLEA